MQGACCFSGVRIYLPALCCRAAGCFSGVGTYMPVTVLQGCRLFKRCRNLFAMLSVAGVQAV